MAESAMTSQIVISRPDQPTFDQDTGTMTAHKLKTIYEGKARVYPAQGPQVSLVGDETTVYRQTYVSIPTLAPVPRVNDLIIIKSGNDPALNNAQLRVMDVTAGGNITPVRTMTCQNVEPNPFWNAP